MEREREFKRIKEERKKGREVKKKEKERKYKSYFEGLFLFILENSQI